MTFRELTDIRAVSATLGVAVAGADDDAVLDAVAAGLAKGVPFFLVGVAKRIHRLADQKGYSLESAIFVEPDQDSEDSVCQMAAKLCARQEANVLMKGLVGTAAFTRAILRRENGLVDDGVLLSHVSLFENPRSNSVFFLTDAAINITPSVEEKKKILTNAVGVVRALGIPRPKIALLAPVEKASSKITSTQDALVLKEWARNGGLGDAMADGPFPLDVAASSEAALIKGIVSEVAGKTDIYLAPNLDAGNILYKAMTVFVQTPSAGILTGARVPVVLTSRSDTDAVKLASLGLGMNVAAAKKS